MKKSVLLYDMWRKTVQKSLFYFAMCPFLVALAHIVI